MKYNIPSDSIFRGWGGSVPPSPQLIQENIITLHLQSDGKIWLRVLFVYGPKAEHTSN